MTLLEKSNTYTRLQYKVGIVNKLAKSIYCDKLTFINMYGNFYKDFRIQLKNFLFYKLIDQRCCYVETPKSLN